nr:hypothetical protein Itr_chr14CG05500 [Ipomoea trifida]
MSTPTGTAFHKVKQQQACGPQNMFSYSQFSQIFINKVGTTNPTQQKHVQQSLDNKHNNTYINARHMHILFSFYTHNVRTHLCLRTLTFNIYLGSEY